MSQTEKRLIDSETNVNIEKIDLISLCVDFIRVFRRMWILVVVLAIIGGAVLGYYEDRRYQAFYTASATFTINIREQQQNGTITNTSYFDNEAAEQMAITFPHILTSGVLQRRVAKELGVSSTSGTISAYAVENTNLLTLSVRDTDPERAFTTLQAVLNNYPALSEVIVGKLNMKLLDETGVPTTPDNPKDLKVSLMKGAMAGTALGFVWMGVVVLLRRTVRREEDCPKYVNQKCLGSVPYVRFKERSKKVERRINITEESVSMGFKESIRIIRNKVERSARENSLKVILVTSALAGEGKSTVAVNLALSLAQAGKQVALVDCDLRNPSDSAILGVKTEKGLIDFLNQSAKLTDCMKKVELTSVYENNRLLFVPGGKPIADGANLLGSESMNQLVTSLKNRMDYVILDSAPVGLLTDASVLAQYADGALFIVKKDYAKVDYILNGIGHLLDSNIHMTGCVLNGD